MKTLLIILLFPAIVLAQDSNPIGRILGLANEMRSANCKDKQNMVKKNLPPGVDKDSLNAITNRAFPECMPPSARGDPGYVSKDTRVYKSTPFWVKK